MANSKTINGFPVISGNSLIQDQILLIDVKGVVRQTQANIVLIEDIWEDLKAGTTKVEQHKTRKNYWYWEFEITDLEDTDKTKKVQVECPIPGPEVFDLDFSESASDSPWAAYWKSVMLANEDSPYYNENAMVSRKVIKAGTDCAPDYSKPYTPKVQSQKAEEIVRLDDDINNLFMGANIC